MVFAKCYVNGCDFQTEDTEGAIVVEILKSHMFNHEQEKTNARNGRAERMKRPTISSGISQQNFSFYLRDWKLYEKYIHPTEITSELIASCDDELRINLYRNYSDIENETKEVILEAIKSFAVKSESFVVHQTNHIKMRQGRDEGIRKFAARLKGQASVCEYVTPCGCKCKCPDKPLVNYGDKALRPIIAANIGDLEIQKDLLSALNNSKNQMSVDEMINFIEGRENGNESAMKLSAPHSNNAVHSNYKKSMKPNGKPHFQADKPNHNKDKCSHCGTSGHGNHWGYANGHIRKKLGCPAYNKICNTCGRYGHFASVCRSSKVNKQTSAAIEEEEAYIEGHIVGGAIGINNE